MAGMKEFDHRCNIEKTDITEYKKSIYESSFSAEQISLIWDFYVVHTIEGSTGLARKVKDYGWKKRLMA